MSTDLDPDVYARALAFAAHAHGEQKVPGNGLPYVVHLAMVAHEVAATLVAEPWLDPVVGIPVALLHDTLEDTNASEAEVEAAFGARVARGVRALTKDTTLPKAERMPDCLARLRNAEPTVQLVKLADRTVNMLPPPAHWSPEKVRAYRAEASEILDVLGKVSPRQAARLAARIDRYPA